MAHVGVSQSEQPWQTDADPFLWLRPVRPAGANRARIHIRRFIHNTYNAYVIITRCVFI